MIAFINSDPLSESIPAILNGNLAETILIDMVSAGKW